MSNNYYYRSDTLVDIHDGTDNYHWLAWISRPDRKPYWQFEDQGGYTPNGYPVFDSYRALGLRRYLPSEQLILESIKMYSEGFSKDDILDRLNTLILQHPGRYETDAEMEERFNYELKQSKKILEERLNKEITVLCWPGGGYTNKAIELSEQAGYKMSTIASREYSTVLDNRNKAYKRIARIGMTSVITKGGYVRSKRTCPSTFSYHLVWELLAQQYHPIVRFLVRANNLIMRFF